MSKQRIFEVRGDKLYADDELALDKLTLTDKRILAHEFMEAAELDVETRSKEFRSEAGWSESEQQGYILNIIARVCAVSKSGYCTRTALVKRACRKYRGINARVLDYHIDKLAEQELILHEDILSGNLLEKRYKRVYYFLGDINDAVKSGKLSVVPVPEHEKVCSLSKEELEYQELLAATRKKYESSLMVENSQNDQ